MDKLRIAEKLDAFGIHYVEGGWPGSNPKTSSSSPRPNARSSSMPPGRVRLNSRKGAPVESDDQVRLLLEAETQW